MCELLGLSFKLETSPKISYKAFRNRAHARPPQGGNPDGWGLAWYPDGRAAAIIKEEIAADRSSLAAFLGGYERLRSTTFIAHVRKASRGQVAYRNTHPFVRELNGHEYTFAHNGTIRGVENLHPGDFRPLGETDSERLFCRLLSIIREIGGISSADDCAQLWDALLSLNQLSSGGRASKLNMLLSDGETLIAYRDIKGEGTLHRLERPEYYSERATVLDDDDYCIEYPIEKGENQSAVIIATHRLTDEQGWTLLEPGELCAFRMGRTLYSSVSSLIQVCGVEVYDSSAWLDGCPEAPYVAGMPSSLRSVLEVSVGDTVVVKNEEASLDLTVYETDRRLLANGTCSARNPREHICLTSVVRERLGLTEMGTRRNTSKFSRIYTPVCVQSW